MKYKNKSKLKNICCFINRNMEIRKFKKFSSIVLMNEKNGKNK